MGSCFDNIIIFTIVYSKSVWELVYFATIGNSATPLDSRELQGINTAAMGLIQSPAGTPYDIMAYDSDDMYWRYDTEAFSMYLDNKIDRDAQPKFERALKTQIETAQPGMLHTLC